MIKRVSAVFMAVLLLGINAYASDFDTMTDAEKAQAVGVYVEEVIKYINENYIGEKEVDAEKLMHAAIKAMASELDEYSDYLTPEEYADIKESESKLWYSPDFVCMFNEDGYPIITSIKNSSKAYQAGLREGNAIRSIDGLSAYGIGEEEYNSLVTQSDAVPIKMKISTGGSIVSEINVPVSLIVTPTVVSYDIANAGKGAESIKFDDPSVGYIKITTFSNGTADEFRTIAEQLKNKKCTKLILDLRGNTGGYVDEAIKIAQMIVPEGTIITTRDKMGNGNVYTSNLKDSPFQKYVVLVDSMTASSAEIVASAMQDSGAATIVGEQTYGKGVMQSVMDFSDAGVIKMTTQEYITRNGKKINGIGITPDVNIHKIMFLAEDSTLDNSDVIAAMKFLGFRIDEKNSVEKAIGSYQAEIGLPVTYKIDKSTVNAINLEIYEDMINNDRILTAGYLNILS